MMRVLAAVALLVAAGCATVDVPVASSGALEREVLLTVAQPESSGIGLTGPLDSRYLRRRGYGAPPPDVDRLLDQLAKEHGIRRKDGWPIRSLEVYCEVFVVPEDRDLDEVLERLSADPRVDLAQPMHQFRTLGSRYDDPYADLLPAARELGVEEAHTLATGKGVQVAVIDSGVDAKHPELEGRIGFSRDVVDPRLRRSAAEVHGTAVAGVIASAANNRQGIFGIAPDVEIVALRACWAAPAAPAHALCSSFTLAQALEIAIDVGADVINLSLGGPADPLLERLVAEAVARGAVVVAAAPPDASDEAEFPASVPGVLVAHPPSEAAALDRPFGLPAPADEILTTTPGGGYAIFSGTSLAAAHLSGIVALLRERSPGIETPRVAELLRQSVVRLADGMTVNACYAVEALADVHVCGVPVAAALQRERKP
ncbi:MAG TPA: S8 family serine peptidase [Gammaproteobacteria bacterium]